MGVLRKGIESLENRTRRNRMKRSEQKRRQPRKKGENKPSIKQRVTVSILPSTTAQEEVELDYRVLVTGDYSKSKMGSHKDGKKLKDRKVRVISKKGDFSNVLRDLNPQLKINVDDKISGEEDKKFRLKWASRI